MRIYVDSDILIWHLRGEPRATALLRSLSSEPGAELWTGALQRAEVLFFARPSEASSTRTLLSRFKTAPVTQNVVDDAAEIFRAWNPSHGIDVHDALLAATILDTGGRLYTQNIKHFPMPDLPVTRGW